jgi:hypothetical protein
MGRLSRPQLDFVPYKNTVNLMAKKKNVGGRPRQTAEHHSGPDAAKNFHEHMKRVVAVPKAHVAKPKVS